MEMLLLIDQRAKTKDFVERFRMGLATSHPQFAGDLYPEWKKAQAGDARPTGDPDEDPELQKQIVWSVPQSEEEERELLDWVNSRMTGQVTSAELNAGGWL